MKDEIETRAGVPAYALIRDIIRAEIVSGKQPSGSRLTTASLVARFNISQMPVREALQALEGEGLVIIQPHKGAAVLSLDSIRVGKIYDLRGAVEVLMMRTCLPNITNAAVAELSTIHDALKTAVAADDPETVFGLNQRFHAVIYHYSYNPEALGIYDRYANFLGTLRGRYGFSRRRMDEMWWEHEDILEALKAQDVPRLEALMRLHVEGAKIDLVSRIRLEEQASVAR